MLTGTIKERDGRLYVVYEMPLENEPKLKRLWWLITMTRANAYSGSRPSAGDKAYSFSDGNWSTSRREGGSSTGSVFFPGSQEAAFVEFIPIPCPKVRKGIQTRYFSGRWEKYSKVHGWIPA